jgi:hypothetical protein
LVVACFTLLNQRKKLVDGLGAEFCTTQLPWAAGEVGCAYRNAKREDVAIGDKNEARAVRLSSNGLDSKTPAVQRVRWIDYLDLFGLGLSRVVG